ncbi:hypothetical protein ACFFRR_004354 [Megaselia abdita]
MKVIALVFAILAVVAGDLAPPNQGPPSDVVPFSFTPANICRLMVDGTYIVNPTDCNQYYKCNGGSPTSYSCPQGTIFNKETGICTVSSNIGCNNINTICAGKSKGTFLGDISSCDGYYYCDGVNVAGQHGFCPKGENFNPQSQECVYNNIYSCSKSNSMQPICDYVGNGKYFGVTTSCSDWAICKNGQYQTGTCSAGLFNTNLGVCDEKVSEVKCTQASMPHDPVANHVLQGKNCAGWSTKYIADPSTCSGFYYCNPSNIALWGQCASNKFFSNGKCVDRSTVHCNSVDICENTANSLYTWVNDPLDCHKYYYCKDNTRSPTSTACPNNNWFNEVLQQCTTVRPTYAACTGSITPPTSTGTDRPRPPGPY